MAVSSGDPRAPLLGAQKMDEEFYGIFHLLCCVQWKGEGETVMRMMGDKEDDMWSRLESAAMKADIGLPPSS